MNDFTIVERTEPFTLKEVLDFIDDTNISKIDAHELKSRIADMAHAIRVKAIDEFMAEIITYYEKHRVEPNYHWIKVMAEQLKEGAV